VGYETWPENETKNYRLFSIMCTVNAKFSFKVKEWEDYNLTSDSKISISEILYATPEEMITNEL
jgi:hypothetical protein